MLKLEVTCRMQLWAVPDIVKLEVFHAMTTSSCPDIVFARLGMQAGASQQVFAIISQRISLHVEAPDS